MIKEIHLKNVATYPSDRVEEVKDLTKVNFFYGSNGSGKTTISRVLLKPSEHRSCNIIWDSSPQKTFVYNEDFVQQSVFQSEQIKGIYTFGKETKEIEDQVISLKQEADKLEGEVTNDTAVRKGKEDEKQQLEEGFREECWALKVRYDPFFEVAFTRFRGDKQKFMQKVLEEQSNKSDLQTEEFLKTRASTVFNKDIETVANIPTVNTSSLIAMEASADILKVKILGKTDVPISALITRLENSDWVKAGLSFLEKGGQDRCPFCQQGVSETLKQEFDRYFDETFEEQMKALKKFSTEYSQAFDSIIDQIQGVLRVENTYLDTQALIDLRGKLVPLKELNEGRIREKIEKPSNEVELQPCNEVLDEVNTLISKAQSASVEHNKTVDNLATERALLTEQVWRFISSEMSQKQGTYLTSVGNVSKAITGLGDSIARKNQLIAQKRREILELESQITNIEGTIATINSMLTSFGFTNFSLKKSPQNGFYQVVRENGTDAKKTLSEGEKTFLSFLYFYQLVQGSNEVDGIAESRVVVFDDPISSLDSDILFIVSSLIRKIIEDVKEGHGFVKQVFVLTHNVYFHKEIAFQREGNDFGHWIVRKIDGRSFVTHCESNPVKTSYQLLWEDVKTGSGATIHNTMRRILENYFKILGGVPINDLEGHFEGEDKMICRSLISWIHDGSHSVFDNIYVDNGDDLREKYLVVFKKIFEVKNHIEHFKMMMGEV